MIRGRAFWLAVLVLAAGLGAYVATLSARLASSRLGPVAADPVLDWLKVPPAQRQEISALDATFPMDVQQLRQDLEKQRAALAAALEANGSTDAQIRQHSEAAIAAAAALERRVTDYLLLIRDHLTPQQQKQLFSLAASSVREGRGQGLRWRHGQQEGGPATRPGGGMGRGRGRGS